MDIVNIIARLQSVTECCDLFDRMLISDWAKIGDKNSTMVLSRIKALMITSKIMYKIS